MNEWMSQRVGQWVSEFMYTNGLRLRSFDCHAGLFKEFLQLSGPGWSPAPSRAHLLGRSRAWKLVEPCISMSRFSLQEQLSWIYSLGNHSAVITEGPSPDSCLSAETISRWGRLDSRRRDVLDVYKPRQLPRRRALDLGIRSAQLLSRHFFTLLFACMAWLAACKLDPCSYRN